MGTAKKKKKEQRASLGRGKVSLEKTVCMQRSHGEGARDDPQEHLRGRRERVVAARHPPQATARLASLSDIFPI